MSNNKWQINQFIHFISHRLTRPGNPIKHVVCCQCVSIQATETKLQIRRQMQRQTQDKDKYRSCVVRGWPCGQCVWAYNKLLPAPGRLLSTLKWPPTTNTCHCRENSDFKVKYGQCTGGSSARPRSEFVKWPLSGNLKFLTLSLASRCNKSHWLSKSQSSWSWFFCDLISYMMKLSPVCRSLQWCQWQIFHEAPHALWQIQMIKTLSTDMWTNLYSSIYQKIIKGLPSSSL